MLKYIVKRLLWFIPTLFIITLLGFTLLVNAPGDPVDLLVNSLNSRNSNSDAIEAQKAQWRKELGLDLPLFYLSVTSFAEPDTLYKIHNRQKLKTYHALLNKSGNAGAIHQFIEALHKSKLVFTKEFELLKQDSSKPFIDREHAQLIISNLNALALQADTQQMTVSLQTIFLHSKMYSPSCLQQLNQLQSAFNTLKTKRTVYKNYIPKLIWYGSVNRYHHWLFGGADCKGVIRGDFGISYIKKEPVLAIIKDKIGWSLFFSITSILLAYAISIPIGMAMARKPESKKNRRTEIILFVLYAMPSFFVGVLLLMLFANPDVVSLLPPSGIMPIGGYADDAGLAEKIAGSLPYMILPLICYTYSSLAFISRLTQTAIAEQLPLDYIKTARAKGLSERAIIRKHALKNSMLPLITVFSALFPTIIGGSVIIETMFTIPGMGLETIRAISAKDYPIVIAFITLSSLLTLFSYLMADVLYAWFDPRIRYKR